MSFTRCTEMKRKHKGLFGKILVVFIIAQILIYTYVNMYLSYKVSVEISPTLTGCFFAFFGFEAGLLSKIKTTKIKKGDENNEHDTDSECNCDTSDSDCNGVSDSVYPEENERGAETDNSDDC